MAAVADVVVAGGGLAGSLSALLAARGGFRTTLICAPRPPQRLPFPETFAAGACSRLVALGLGEILSQAAIGPCTGLRIAWDGAPRSISSVGVPGGLGTHVDRARLDPSLLAAAVRAGTHVVSGTAVNVVRTADVFRVGLSSTRSLAARVVIDATGRRAALAAALGAERRISRRSIAIGRWFAGGRSSGELTVERVRDGWWYACPGGPGRVFVAHLTDPSAVPRHPERRSQWWRSGLDAAPLVRELVHGLADSGRLSSRCADSGWSAPAAGDGWFSVGDAALACDPAAGAGATVAVETACFAAEAAAAALRGDREGAVAYGRLLAVQQTNYSDELGAHFAPAASQATSA